MLAQATLPRQSATAQPWPRCTRCGATTGLETRYVIFGERAYGVGCRCRDRDACRARTHQQEQKGA